MVRTARGGRARRGGTVEAGRWPDPIGPINAARRAADDGTEREHGAGQASRTHRAGMAKSGKDRDPRGGRGAHQRHEIHEAARRRGALPEFQGD